MVLLMLGYAASIHRCILDDDSHMHVTCVLQFKRNPLASWNRSSYALLTGECLLARTRLLGPPAWARRPRSIRPSTACPMLVPVLPASLPLRALLFQGSTLPAYDCLDVSGVSWNR